MPPLVFLVFTVLIGWPLLKLAVTIVSRGRWDRQRILRAELEGDPRYGLLEHRIVAEKFREGKGSVGQLALPFVAFFGGLAFVAGFPDQKALEAARRDDIAVLRRRLLQFDYPNATETTFELLRDERFQALGLGAFELQMLRYPIATIATGLAIVPSLVLIAIFYGVKSSLRHVAQRIVESSQQTVKTFATLIANSTITP